MRFHAFKHYGHKWLVLTLTTLAIAGFVNLLEKAGLLRGLEARLATTPRLPGPGLTIPPLDEMPAVVVIDDRAYESYFRRISPLDRPTLARIIGGILATKPILLAIDLDIAPSDEEEWQQALPLYDLLCRHVRPDFLPSAAVSSCLDQTQPPASCDGLLLTMIDPFDVVSNPVQDTIQAWQKKMRDVLGDCFSFAKAHIEQHDTMVIYYNTALDNLAVRSYMLLRQHRYPDWPAIPENYRGIIRTDLLKRANSDLRFSSAEADRKPHIQLMPSQLAFPVRAALDGEFIAQQAPRPLNGNTRSVFLGGSWGNADKWYTASNDPSQRGDRTSGVVIHAAIFHSLVNPLSIANKIALLALDLLFGIVFGIFFEWAWSRYNAAARHFRQQLPAHHLPFHPVLAMPLYRSYLPVFLYGSASLLLFISALFASLSLVSIGLSFGWWIDVTAIVIGIILHQIIASREHVHASAAFHGAGNPPETRNITGTGAGTGLKTSTLNFAGLALWWLRWISITALILYLLNYKFNS